MGFNAMLAVIMFACWDFWPGAILICVCSYLLRDD